VSRYRAPMTTVARSFLRDRHRAEDAVQQALLQAWRASSTFDPDRPLGPWLYTITRRVCLDILRTDRRVPAPRSIDHDAPGSSDTSATVERSWLAWEVRRAVDGLPADERTIVRLTHLEGMSQAAIAQRLDLPLGTVKSRAFRAHRRLAHVLGHTADGRGIGTTVAL
jgi:RNA polymerase sigma-70 factor (ECF subfamily)